MDHAHLLQRAGRNLRRVHGRNRPTPRSPPRAFQIHRSAMPSPRRHHHAHLHRRLPLLRHQSLARLPQYSAPHLIYSAKYSRWGMTPLHSISARILLLCSISDLNFEETISLPAAVPYASRFVPTSLARSQLNRETPKCKCLALGATELRANLAAI